jgi:hypothetical protein
MPMSSNNPFDFLRKYRWRQALSPAFSAFSKLSFEKIEKSFGTVFIMIVADVTHLKTSLKFRIRLFINS